MFSKDLYKEFNTSHNFMIEAVKEVTEFIQEDKCDSLMITRCIEETDKKMKEHTTFLKSTSEKIK